jgi:hypothetical protein
MNRDDDFALPAILVEGTKKLKQGKRVSSEVSHPLFPPLSLLSHSVAFLTVNHPAFILFSTRKFLGLWPFLLQSMAAGLNFFFLSFSFPTTRLTDACNTRIITSLCDALSPTHDVLFGACVANVHCLTKKMLIPVSSQSIPDAHSTMIALTRAHRKYQPCLSTPPTLS